MHSSQPGPIHERHYIWNPLVATNGSILSASFPPLLSFRPKWGRTLRLSLEVGMSDLKGKPASAYLCCWWSLEACARTLWWCQVGTRAQNQPYYRVFRRSWKILQTAVVDLEHSWTFGATGVFLFRIGRRKTHLKAPKAHPNPVWILINDPFGSWRGLRMSTASMVELKRVKCFLGVLCINFRAEVRPVLTLLWCVCASKWVQWFHWFHRFCLSSRFQFEMSDSAISHSLSFQASRA